MKLKLQHSSPTLHKKLTTQVCFCLIARHPPSHLVFFRAIYPDGSTADKRAAGNKDCPARPRSQRPIGKPCGPAPRQSGAGRNPWPPDRKG